MNKKEFEKLTEEERADGKWVSCDICGQGDQADFDGGKIETGECPDTGHQLAFCPKCLPDPNPWGE